MTKIQWTNSTWNPVHGCTHAGSPSCDHCYARRMSKRLAGRYGYPPAPDNFKVTLRPDRLEQPLKWRKPRKIFVCSMSDLFHDDVPSAFIASIWTVMQIAHAQRGHIFQVLTKRPARMLEFVSDFTAWEAPDGETGRDICLGIWLGVTVENQAAANERIPLLLQTPAAVRFVSAEPLLEQIDLDKLDQPTGDRIMGLYGWHKAITLERVYGLDWVITGGETGPGARPSHPDWCRSLRDQCQAAGVDFFFKQWGEWWPVNHDHTTGNNVGPSTKSCWVDIRGNSFPRYSAMFHDPHKMYCIGSKRAGHKLDGVEWRQMPEVTQGDVTNG